MIELEEWRARPTRENRLTLGAALAELPRPLSEVDSEIVLEWAIGLPVVGGNVLWTAEPNNAALAFAIRGGYSTRRGLPWFAFEAFETARRIGRGRAIDRAIRVLLLESMNETDPCFWAAVALALRFPRYARFHGWPIRVQRALQGAVETRTEDELPFPERAAEDDEPDDYLVSARDDLRHWDELDEPFVPCGDCQTSASATLCGVCVARRAEIQARNEISRRELEEPVPPESVWRRFPEVLGELAKDRDAAAQVIRSKLAEFALEGGVWPEQDDHRALRPPQKF